MAIGSRFPTEQRPNGPTIFRWQKLVAWLVVAAVVTALLWVLHSWLDKAHLALTYLLLVLVASAHGGRVVGFVLSVVSFLAFNFFLLPPFYTFKIDVDLDWWVLIASLMAGAAAAELVHRQQVSALLAQRRAAEIDRLAGLGAESLAAPSAAQAVEAIARVIAAELPTSKAEILVSYGAEAPAGEDHALSGSGKQMELMRNAIEERRIVGLRPDGALHPQPSGVSLSSMASISGDFAELLVPLHVRDRSLGLLRLVNPAGLRFTSAQASFADVLAYYAALAVERARLEAEAEHMEGLREADRLKDALLASVSHDLRTPLTSIRAAASELRAGGEEKAAVIVEEADRLNRVVTDLLDLSRAAAGAMPVHAELNAAEDLIGTALQRLNGAASGAADVRVVLPRDGTLPVGRFDFVHALRALTNILENALRHSPEPGSVEIQVEVEQEDLVITVSDRGPGISAEDQPRLFEPFFRSASAAGTQGTGLGLAIARRVAEAQGGRVLYRPRPGGGSVFELRLPAVFLTETIS